MFNIIPILIRVFFLLFFFFSRGVGGRGGGCFRIIFKDTPLHLAIVEAKHGSTAALVQLETIDLQAKNKRDFTALHLACIKGNSR